MTNPTRPTPAPGDPSAFLARLAAMERRIADLEANQPGYGNLSAGSRGNQMRIPRYMRDLYDAELWDIADGQAIVWDASPGVGKFRPGSAGGGARSFLYVWRATNQSIPTGAGFGAGIVFGYVAAQAGAADCSLGVGGNVVFNAAGLYVVSASASWASNSTGWRQMEVFTAVNPVTTFDRRMAVTGNYTSHTVTTTCYIDASAVGTGIEVEMSQDSGGALNIMGQATQPCHLTVTGYAI